MKGIFYLVLFAFIVSHVPPASASPNLKSLCSDCFSEKKKEYLDLLTRIEENYSLYRAAEESMRRLSYDRLWEIRRRRIDPLSKEARAGGDEDEKNLMNEIRKIQERSTRYASDVEIGIKQLIDFSIRFNSCCRERSYQEAVLKYLKPAQEELLQLRRHFDGVVETEHDWSAPIIKLNAGAGGLYPEDALETPDQHTDYYWRFVNSRNALAYADDKKTFSFIEKIREELTWNQAGGDCCLKCGSDAQSA